MFVDRAIEGIRNAQKPKVAAAQKELDEMRAMLRKLEDRIGMLEARSDTEDADSTNA